MGRTDFSGGDGGGGSLVRGEDDAAAVISFYGLESGEVSCSDVPNSPFLPPPPPLPPPLARVVKCPLKAPVPARKSACPLTAFSPPSPPPPGQRPPAREGAVGAAEGP